MSVKGDAMSQWVSSCLVSAAVLCVVISSACWWSIQASRDEVVAKLSALEGGLEHLRQVVERMDPRARSHDVGEPANEPQSANEPQRDLSVRLADDAAASLAEISRAVDELSKRFADLPRDANLAIPRGAELEDGLFVGMALGEVVQILGEDDWRVTKSQNGGVYVVSESYSQKYWFTPTTLQLVHVEHPGG